MPWITCHCPLPHLTCHLYTTCIFCRRVGACGLENCRPLGGWLGGDGWVVGPWRWGGGRINDCYLVLIVIVPTWRWPSRSYPGPLCRCVAFVYYHPFAGGWFDACRPAVTDCRAFAGRYVLLMHAALFAHYFVRRYRPRPNVAFV